jgi:hypothetical protein
VDERVRRIGENEAIFRALNERLRELGESFSLVAEHAEFVCECGDVGCTERIPLTLEVYEAVRADARRFVIVPGHEIADVERVLERHEHYAVIEKLPGMPTQIAKQTDASA